MIRQNKKQGSNLVERVTRRDIATRLKKGRDDRRASGRPKGKKNLVSVGMKEAILQAISEMGNDGKGKEGAVGYFKKLGWLWGKNNPNIGTFGKLASQVLGHTMTVNTTVEAKVEDRPYTQEEIIEKLKSKGINLGVVNLDTNDYSSDRNPKKKELEYRNGKLDS